MAEVQLYQIGEVAQLRRYLAAQLVVVEVQLCQLPNWYLAAQGCPTGRRYLAAQLVQEEVQLCQIGEVAQLRRYLAAQLVQGCPKRSSSDQVRLVRLPNSGGISPRKPTFSKISRTTRPLSSVPTPSHSPIGASDSQFSFSPTFQNLPSVALKRAISVSRSVSGEVCASGGVPLGVGLGAAVGVAVGAACDGDLVALGGLAMGWEVFCAALGDWVVVAGVPCSDAVEREALSVAGAVMVWGVDTARPEEEPPVCSSSEPQAKSNGRRRISARAPTSKSRGGGGADFFAWRLELLS